MTPTNRTMAVPRKRGLKAGIVERWIGRARRPGGVGVRQDLFGIIDVIALDPARGVIGIQICGTGYAEHYKKITEEKRAETVAWLSTPGAILELWGWRKLKGQGYQPRIHIFTLGDLL